MATRKNWVTVLDGRGEMEQLVVVINLDLVQEINFSDAVIEGQEDRPFREAEMTMANGSQHQLAREGAEALERWVQERDLHVYDD